MVKKIVPMFGETRTDAIVRDWLGRHNIDLDLVQSYRIVRRGGDLPIIELTMYFDDTEQVAPGVPDAQH